MAFFLMVICMLIVLAAIWFGLPIVFRYIWVRAASRSTRETKSIVLTYDDGPSASVTPRLLELLDRHDTKAVFFPLGINATDNPDLVQSCLASGHHVGSHTKRHLHAWKSNPFAQLRDIKQGISIVKSMGADGKSFRPTYGKLTFLTLSYLLFNKVKLVWWTIDTKDSLPNRLSTPEVLSEISARQGGIVLMHDGTSYVCDNHDEYVLGTTSEIIQFADTHGYEIRVA